MKVIILSTDKSITTWRSLEKKKKFFDDLYASGKNANFEPIEVKYIDVIPKVVGGRIEADWLKQNNKPYFDNGYDLIKFHCSMKQWKEWGIDPTLRGSNPIEKGEQENNYFSADEKTLRNGLNRFEQTGAHEDAHAYFQQTGLLDTTHAWHGANADISGLFKTFDWSLYQPERMKLKKYVSVLQRLVAWLKQQKPLPPLLHPVAKYKDYISAPYGVVDKKYYPLSHHHIGTDYACPIGTPVVAPYDGETTVETFSAILGNYIHYQYTYKGQIFVTRFLHLDKAKPTGSYKRGDIIGYSGNTGKVTGAHLHVDVWPNTVNTQGVNHIDQMNWDTLTVDPVFHYNS